MTNEVINQERRKPENRHRRNRKADGTGRCGRGNSGAHQ